jgi:hypothetical protein|tara:strand:+ start:158 stop:490 length:333 start_codon:yes stop_codon:yes gene_type:complete
MITTRNNRKMAVTWAKSIVKRNSSMVMSDQYWAPFINNTQIQHTKRKLKQLGILAFDFGKGAILIHKDNPKLSVEIIDCKDIDGKTYIGGTFTNTVDGEDFCTILKGETV